MDINVVISLHQKFKRQRHSFSGFLRLGKSEGKLRLEKQEARDVIFLAAPCDLGKPPFFSGSWGVHV